MKPIAYTLGEPAGIGLDIILQLAQKSQLNDVVCIGDCDALTLRAQKLGLESALNDLKLLHVPVTKPDVIGHADVANVAGVINMLDTAIDGCLNNEFSAVVTGPLHKGIINDAGVAFSGHTEYLAMRTKAPLPVMLLASDTLRVALITTHLPLNEVSAAISQDLIIQVCEIIDQDLRIKYGIENPKQLICGLNPHAGEGGHLGMEEIETIIPALEQCRANGLDVIGPLPADTLFTAKYLQDADVAVAMYHDQGLPVLKSQSFGQAANITLGLPIIRSSVDHGTAFDLAGSGKADIGSLRTAIKVAREMSLASIGRAEWVLLPRPENR